MFVQKEVGYTVMLNIRFANTFIKEQNTSEYQPLLENIS